MPTQRAVELLQQIGMSGYEAKAYVALLGASSPMNGYEVAKQSGVPRSTVYETLAKLAARGAASVVSNDDGTSRYVALESNRFVEGMRRDMSATLEGLDVVLSELSGKQNTTVVVHVNGRAQVRDRFIDVINKSRERCWLSVWPRGAEELRESATVAVDRGVELTSVVFGRGVDFPGQVIVHEYSDPDTVVNVMGCLFYVAVADQSEAIIGIRENGSTWGVWSDDLAIVTLALQYVYHDISMQLMGNRLAELGEPDFIGRHVEFSDMHSTAKLGRSLLYLAECTASSSRGVAL
ncbi:MAG: TrmB family transcriptional regulator [Actinomycetota bacterium]